MQREGRRNIRLSSTVPGDEALGLQENWRQGEGGLAGYHVRHGFKAGRAVVPPPPLIASDNWDPIRDAVTEVYGVEYLPVHDGRGRPTSESAFVPRQDLKYVQVVKERDEHGNLKKVVTKIVYGDPVEVRASLAISGSGGISTSSVERQNPSVRNYGRRFVTRTICFSKDGKYLKWYLEVLQAWFNFTKTNRSLRVRNSDGSFTHRTPAMAQGLADRPLTWKDILRWRCN